MEKTRKIHRTRDEIFFLHDADALLRSGHSVTATAEKLGKTRNAFYHYVGQYGFRVVEDGHGNRFLVDINYEDTFEELEQAGAFEEITL